jgi:hypothetical protein
MGVLFDWQIYFPILSSTYHQNFSPKKYLGEVHGVFDIRIYASIYGYTGISVYTQYTIVSIYALGISLPVTQYVHIQCNRPLRSCYSMVTGHVLSALWVCNHRADFQREIVRMLKVYGRLGYSQSRLVRQIRDTVDKYHTLVNRSEFDPLAVVAAVAGTGAKAPRYG